jgi:apolipoprotein N-acyltransferase
MRPWQVSLAGSVLTALLLALLFPPFDLALLAPVALSPLLFALAHEPSGGRRFVWGWLCGFLYWIVVCHWIANVLAAYGGLNGPLSLLALVLFAIAKGLHMAVFAWLVGMVMQRPWAIPAAAALWTGIERTHAPLGFPWLALGNAGIAMSLPLRIAPYVGVYGVSFILAMLGCAVALVALRRKRRQLAWLLVLPLLALLPAAAPRQAPRQSAVAVQTNVGGDARWSQDEAQRAVRRFSLLTLEEALDPAKPKPALLLWPEAPAPFYYYDDPQFRLQVTETARLAATPLLFSGVAFTPAREPLNSAVLLSAEGALSGRYDKVKLVPFGEYVPPGFAWIGKISGEAGNFAAGRAAQVFVAADHSIGAFICYESAFPHHVRQFARSGAEVLVNLTNDGYFGQAAAPRRQHLLLARMRAVENGRWLLRPSNDGITASIDPAGRVWDQLPERRRLAGRLRFAWERRQTPYTKYGDWFAWLCLAAGALAVLREQIPSYRPVR